MTPPPTNENTSHHLQPTPPNAIHQSKKRSSMASLSLSLSGYLGFGNVYCMLLPVEKKWLFSSL
jgi:hypothetical protein